MNGFSITESVDLAPSNDNFRLHTHDYYELFVFGEGDACHIVEGSSYRLEKDDMIILRPDEMHRVRHNSPAKYRRTVISVGSDFFRANCPEYERFFWSRECGKQNLLPSEVCRAFGVTDALSRVKAYSSDYKKVSEPAAKAAFIEMLYLVSRAADRSRNAAAYGKTAPVIAYINGHIAEDITLSSLAEKFFMSKAYLSRLFHTSTGLTVGEYLARKRVLEAERCYREGMSITVSCLAVGFSDYSSFYRTYRKVRGQSPRTGMKRCI